LASILDHLRGPSKSLRHRFVLGPAAKLRYAVKYRAMGRARLDYWADATDAAQLPLLDMPLSDDYQAKGRVQFDYLVANGLKPEHRFLDYGCGPMRGGVFVVPYLTSGFYVGADISRRFMQRGIRLMETAGIERSRYHLVTVRDFDLSDLHGFRFDMAASFSALQYVADDDLKRILSGIRRVLDGKFFYDFPMPDKIGELRVKGQYYRSPERIAALSEPLGFSVAIETGYMGGGVAVLTTR